MDDKIYCTECEQWVVPDEYGNVDCNQYYCPHSDGDYEVRELQFDE